MQSSLYFEDLEMDQSWDSPRRTVTESDVVIFAGMTGDYDRLHVDHDFAKSSRFGQPLAHGIMGLAWAAGLSTTAPSVHTMALVEVKEWQFLLPVHIGDTVFARTEVVGLEPAGRSAGRVRWCKSLINQEGEVVQKGQFVSLVELAARKKKKSTKEKSPVPKSHLSMTSKTGVATNDSQSNSAADSASTES